MWGKKGEDRRWQEECSSVDQDVVTDNPSWTREGKQDAQSAEMSKGAKGILLLVLQKAEDGYWSQSLWLTARFCSLHFMVQSCYWPAKSTNVHIFYRASICMHHSLWFLVQDHHVWVAETPRSGAALTAFVCAGAAGTVKHSLLHGARATLGSAKAELWRPNRRLTLVRVWTEEEKKYGDILCWGKWAGPAPSSWLGKVIGLLVGKCRGSEGGGSVSWGGRGF